jgi:uncharacterized protein
MTMLNALNAFQNFFGNKAIIIPIISWAVAQIIKVIVASLRAKRMDLSFLINSGGMPSSHAAMVCSLATVVAVTDGIQSTTFAISGLLAAVVMYDAAGVRWAVSRQAKILNHIIDELYKEKPNIEQHLRELVGHTRLEVLFGAILGILLALILA